MSTTMTRTDTTGTATKMDTGLLLLRIALGITFMMHGAQLMFGAFGGPGLKGVMAPPAEHGMGPMGLLVAVGEFFGGLGILVGVLTRFSAAAIAVIMLGAIALVHLPNGFFMNWYGKQHGEGFEYHLLVIGMCLTLLLAGPGRFAVQNALPGVLRKL